MKLLISGCTGFVGSNLLPYLRSDFSDIEIIPLVSRPRGLESEVLWRELDKLDGDTFTAVIHLAGLAHDTKNTQNEEAYYKVNYELTKMLYDWYLKSNANTFIYMSSVKAVTDSVEGVLSEDAIAIPATAYGKSKLKAEEYIFSTTPNLPEKQYYILRPCMIHGPGNKGNLNLFYQFVKRGYPYPLGAYENKRSFLSINNLLYVIKRLLTEDVTSGIYNVADDEPLEVSQLFRIIASVTGKKEKVWKIPKGVVEVVAKIGDIFRLPVTSEKLGKMTENFIVSNDKLKLALQMKKMPVETQEGIRKTIQSFEYN